MRRNEIHVFGALTACSAAQLRALVKAPPIEIRCTPEMPFREQPAGAETQTIIVRHDSPIAFQGLFGGMEFLCGSCAETTATKKA